MKRLFSEREIDPHRATGNKVLVSCNGSHTPSLNVDVQRTKHWNTVET